MNRMRVALLEIAGMTIVLFFATSRMQGQNPATPSTAQKPGEAESQTQDDEDDNPFAPEPAPSLPPGMTGSDSSDPRAVTTPFPLL